MTTARALDIIIVCMGSLTHLKQSLPAALAQAGASCIVVDYSCPDHCGDWVAETYPAVQVVRVGGRRSFNASEARNCGAEKGNAPWLVFLDIHVILHADFARHLLPRLETGHSYHPENLRPEILGTFVCQRSDFKRVGGYDEVFKGQGEENFDLYERLRFAGILRSSFPRDLLMPLPKQHNSRPTQEQDDNLRTNYLTNILYGDASRDLTQISGKRPDHRTRKQIYGLSRQAVMRSIESKQPNDMHLILNRQQHYGLEQIRVLHYHLDWRPNTWMPGNHQTIPGAQVPSFRSALRVIRKRWPDLLPDIDDNPIFLLAACHRSGSTMVQRMLMKHCWMWGEPYGHSGLLENLALPFRTITTKWPLDDALSTHDRFSKDLLNVWIANLFPVVADLVKATTVYFQTLFRPPANARGNSRWGVKEVRLDADMASFIRWIFPRARLLFLIRDPYASYRSYRRYAHTWFVRWPDAPLNNPKQFGQHWLKLSSGFLQLAAELDAFVLHYEDLVSPDYNVEPLADYLGFKPDMNALEHRVKGEPATGFSSLPDITKELGELREVVDPLAEKLGYRYESDG